MTDEEVERIVNAAALAVPSRPVPHEMLLAALLDQHGHYVSDKIVDLMAATSVAGCTGVVLVTRFADRSIVPPGAVVREVDDYTLFFYQERERRPWVGETEANDPHVFIACVNACARWGDTSHGNESIGYPWGYLHHLKRWDDEPAGDPAAFHAESFASGHLYGTVAVAAGRLGEEVLAITEARWLFPVEAA